MKLSIVSTLYQSEQHILEFCQRTASAAKGIVGDAYEIILVNDGSTDRGLDLAVSLSLSDSHIKVVDLSRNFGHHKAMMTGLKYAKGDRVFLIDSDLEEDPEWMVHFDIHQMESACDSVYGVQAARKGNWFESVSGQWFYRVFRFLTGLKLSDNLVTARLMSRRYVDALLLHEEREVFIAGLWHITGFDQIPVEVNKLSSSESTYTLRKKLSLFIDSVTSFSNKPLIAIFYIGILISMLAGGYTGYLVVNWLFLSKPIMGWTSVMASIWLLGGFIISFIGIVGIYLSKIFSEVKGRPYTIVRNVYHTEKVAITDSLKKEKVGA